MFRIDIICVGKLKKGPWFDLQEDYSTRLKWPTTIHEVESKVTDPKKQQEEENKLILSRLDTKSFVIALDERGDGLRSLDFSQTLEKLRNNGEDRLTFLIGGADGLDPALLKASAFSLAFGPQTWPHALVRVMLAEQMYRVATILAGLPYHRD